ncbi:hypothetical protein [Pelagibacterium lacus]|uniref:hypothetical protein n=1 Tax=Pelagibacterium lacus TaxID=2282655 RepID=UPI0011C06C23|nr:hypothetical protein [Pelagibacterium lacus]
MKDKILEQGAQAFAETLQVPGGRTSFDFAVRAHREWFAQALARGLSWNHIIELLRRVGVRRDDGRPLSRGHLSAVYSRQRARRSSDIAATTPTQRAVAKTPMQSVRTMPRPTATTGPTVEDHTFASQSSRNTATENAQIRSFMARAANQRNHNAEE